MMCVGVTAVVCTSRNRCGTLACRSLRPWAIFLLEFASVMWLTDDRDKYAKKAWLDVFIIVTSFPLLPALLEATRLVGLVRLSRVLRLPRWHVSPRS